MIIERQQNTLRDTQHRLHYDCYACGLSKQDGMRLTFDVQPDGSVAAEFDCTAQYTGYPNRMHGGVISTILDSAMTNCLFALGKAAVTAELQVRYLQPVRLGSVARIHARVERSVRKMHVVKAELFQSGRLKVKAVGKFIEQADAGTPEASLA